MINQQFIFKWAEFSAQPRTWNPWLLVSIILALLVGSIAFTILWGLRK